VALFQVIIKLHNDCKKARSNETEMIKLEEIVEGFSVPPHPKGVSLRGNSPFKLGKKISSN